MAGITEVEVTRLEVDESEEHRDEHATLVVLAREGVVDAGGYLCGHHLLGSEGAEESGGLCHEERGGDTLAAHVAEAEVELVVDEMVAIEVASYLLGGGHRGVEVDVGALGEVAGHHRHLDVTRDTQVALDTLLGDGGLLELVVGGEQLLVGLLEFAVGIFEFQVGHLQALGGAQPEEDEDDEREHDDRGDDDGVARHGLGVLLLELSESEEGVHLRELPFGIVGVDRVVDEVHLVVHLCGLLESS